MTIEELYEYCRNRPLVTEGFPFGKDVLVLKVGGKMFALVNLEERPLRVNLKCAPERSEGLREVHEAVQPGYHMNKKHWNTVTLDGSLPVSLVTELIDHSYELVFMSLPNHIRSMESE